MRRLTDGLRFGGAGIALAAFVTLFGGAAVAQGSDRAGLIAACRSDYSQFCRDVRPGGGAIVACLRAHVGDLAPACRAAVDPGGAERAVAPAASVPGAGPTKIADVAYGPASAQKLDIYAPAAAKGAPVIVMVHGGAWRTGDKARDGVVTAKVGHFVPRGYVFVSIDYRMLPEAGPLAQAEDVARALAFVQSRAATFGGDPRRVVLMGHSAGAHLVALLAAAPEIVTKAGATPAMATIALDSAAYDVPAIMNARHLPLYDRAFGGDPADWRQVSPIDRLGAGRAPAPMLLVCSSRRDESCAQARSFAGRVGGLGGRAEVLPVAMSHMEINRDLGAGGAHTGAVDAFLASLRLP
jgi:arylformamidase